MDWLASSSIWLENNSGQIQIVIGLMALLLAIIGYKAVLKQIKLSNKQDKTAGEQRNFELKTQSLNLALVALEKNHTKIKNQHYVLSQLQKTLKTKEESIINGVNYSEEFDDPSVDDLNALIQDAKTIISQAEDLAKEILDICRKINTINFINFEEDIKYLNTSYSILIEATDDANSIELLSYLFVDDDK